MSINQVIISGHIKRRAEVKEYASANGAFKVAKFTLVSDYPIPNQKKYLFKCTAYNKIAEYISEYCISGTFMNVVGRLHIASYQDLDGNDQRVYEIIVEKIETPRLRGKARKKAMEEEEKEKDQEVYSESGLNENTSNLDETSNLDNDFESNETDGNDNEEESENEDENYSEDWEMPF